MYYICCMKQLLTNKLKYLMYAYKTCDLSMKSYYKLQYDITKKQLNDYN